ncbi:MAG: hypothetical protein IT485_11945 [Gammaproteobacteria bacterium]|nr:hypothetical protein [Gammaproteobacteria bacterium]
MNREDEVRQAERFERAAGGLLRQGAEELDAATQSRLNRARQVALEEYDRARRRPLGFGGGWQAAAAAAAIAVVAVGLWTSRSLSPGAPGLSAGVSAPADIVHPEQAADLEAVYSSDNLELIENLEFYEWLGSGNGAGAAADTDLTS